MKPKKEPVDPSKTPAYNHFPIDKGKPVASNLQFKILMDSSDAVFIKSVMEQYAFDSTQKNLLLDKLSRL